MASKSSNYLNIEEEEIMQTTVSVRGSDCDQDSEEDRLVTAGQHVSTPAPVPCKPKHKALGTPLPEGHGLTQKKALGDQPTSSATKKATPPKPSRSCRSSVSEPSKHRSSEYKSQKSFSKSRPSSSPSFSVPKKAASEPKRPGYSEEHGLLNTLRESHKTTGEDSQIQPQVMDERQARIYIHKETGRILTAPPPKPKRKLAFQEELDTTQPPAKVPKTKERPPPPQLSPPQSPPHSPHLHISPLTSPTPMQ
ncbi:hypothetical protein NDU88_002313 [Pleurodeles waltl]|uniref:Uncharacterized protein n=1 Tax=Pleurodeles waltl TaxID=8319 RepID=A0AAV7M3S1_PLEWA|nr:hypothetical protein NDU88_002313 [Pleurodeles waltl]